MHSIYIGDMPEAIYHPPVYFDNQYENNWITRPLSIEMIKDVDQSTVISSRIIDSPVFGLIPVTSLSGSVKTLMLLAFDQSGKIFNASACGDDCSKWIVTIGKTKDLTINLRHLMHFEGEFEAYIINTEKVVHNQKEFVDEYIKTGWT